jgi:hypothetical protein
MKVRAVSVMSKAHTSPKDVQKLAINIVQSRMSRVPYEIVGFGSVVDEVLSVLGRDDKGELRATRRSEENTGDKRQSAV